MRMGSRLDGLLSECAALEISEEIHGFQTFKSPLEKIEKRYRSVTGAIFQEIRREGFGEQAR